MTLDWCFVVVAFFFLLGQTKAHDLINELRLREDGRGVRATALVVCCPAREKSTRFVALLWIRNKSKRVSV